MIKAITWFKSACPGLHCNFTWRATSRHCLGIFLLLPLMAHGANSYHLLGFVERLCPDEPYCFSLMVEPGYRSGVGEQIEVRFDAATGIFNPENYELTLEQQDIIPGSHLRMLISADSGGIPQSYRASFIWIGD